MSYSPYGAKNLKSINNFNAIFKKQKNVQKFES